MCSKPKSIKLTYGGCIRRITMTQSSTIKYQDLVAAARTLFPELSNKQSHHLYFSYEDNEKDIIHLDSDEELREAFSCQLASNERRSSSSSPSQSLLRFNVHCPSAMLPRHQTPIEYHNNPLHTMELKSKEMVATASTTGQNDVMGRQKKTPLMGLPVDNNKLLDQLESDLLDTYPLDFHATPHSLQQIEATLSEEADVSMKALQPTEGDGIAPLVPTSMTILTPTPTSALASASAPETAPETVSLTVVVQTETDPEPLSTLMGEQAQELGSGLGQVLEG